MDLSPQKVAAVGRATLREVWTNDVTFMAGSIAYAALLSILPLLLLLLVVASAVGDSFLTQRVQGLLQAFLPAAGNEFLYFALVNATNRAGASLVGLVSLVWGTFRVFRGIQTAFAELYDVPSDTTLRGTVRNSVLVFVVLSLATIGSGAGATYLAGFAHWPFAVAVETTALLLGLVAAFFPLYYAFPPLNLSAGEALPGAVVAALGWTALQTVFGLYVSQINTFAAYGTLSGVILLLLWLYGSSLVLLVGVSLNVVVAGRDAGTVGTPGGSPADQHRESG